MAGTSLQRPIGVGPALEKARRIRGLSLDEASRDTRLRVDQLTALEAEDFGALPSDAFVRGALRAYAQYLGVSPEKVLDAYGRHVDEPGPPPPPEGLGRIERAIAATRIRDNQRFLLLGAATLLVLLLLFGLLSRAGAPPPAAIPTTAASTTSATTAIDAVLVAQRPVEITVTEDGAAETYAMEEGETLSFSATEELELFVADGGAVQVTVAGRDLGAPGEPGAPWTESFTLGPQASAGAPGAPPP
jgi:cytoskeletal protein RodZ